MNRNYLCFKKIYSKKLQFLKFEGIKKQNLSELIQLLQGDWYGNNEYKNIILDKKIDYLKLFGLIFIEGPKWCDKTWSENTM